MSEELDPATRELLRSVEELKGTLSVYALREAFDLHVQAIDNIGKVVLTVAAGVLAADEGIKIIETIVEPLEEPTRMVRDFLKQIDA